MGTMQEKRSIKAAEEGWLPQRQKELAEICGKEIPYEVDWDSFAGDLKAIDYTGPLSLELFNREHWEQDLKQVAATGLEKMREGIRTALAT